MSLSNQIWTLLHYPMQKVWWRNTFKLNSRTHVWPELGIRKMPFLQLHSKLERNKVICLTNENNALIEKTIQTIPIWFETKNSQKFLKHKDCQTGPPQCRHFATVPDLWLLHQTLPKSPPHVWSQACRAWRTGCWCRTEPPEHHPHQIFGSENFLEMATFPHRCCQSYNIFVCKKNEFFGMSNQANAINPNLWPSPYKFSAFITKYVTATKTHFQRKWKLNPRKGQPIEPQKCSNTSCLFSFLQNCCPREQPQAPLSRAQHQQGAEHSGWSCGAMPLHCQPASGKPATSTHKLASVGTNGKAKEWNRHSFSN